jgi:glucose-1-phosphate thymidylyltransferase
VRAVCSRYSFVKEKVTIAIIDAAHEDEPQVGDRPPPCRYLTSIANLPLIAHVLDGLAGNGIEHVLIVTGQELAEELPAALGDGEPWGLRLSYLESDPDAGHGETISELRAAVDGQPALIHPGDCLFPGRVSQLRERFGADDLDLVMLARSGPEPLDAQDGKAKLRRHPRVTVEQPLSTALIVGPSAWEVLDQLPYEPHQPTMFLRSLSEVGCRVGVCDLGEHWFYDDSTEALLAANRMLLDARMPEPIGVTPCGNSEIQGRVDISPSALVSESRIRGPVVIGPDAVVEESFIGPYTAIGAGAAVIGAEIDNAMVLPEAQVRYPGCRLEASVIGERAMVSRSFAPPKALHLRLGPDASVILG